jgi:hypothetical protein
MGSTTPKLGREPRVFVLWLKGSSTRCALTLMCALYVLTCTIVAEYGLPCQRESRGAGSRSLGTYSIPEYDIARLLSRRRGYDRREIHPRLARRLKRLGSLPTHLSSNLASPPSLHLSARTTPRGPGTQKFLQRDKFLENRRRKLQIRP